MASNPKPQASEQVYSPQTVLDGHAWAASLDLKDAYLHVPVCREHWKFLLFQYQNVRYEF